LTLKLLESTHKKKKRRENFINIPEAWSFLQIPHNVQKFLLTPSELSIALDTHSYKLGHKLFKKDQNTPDFLN
jgi:hypothetical protein